MRHKAWTPTLPRSKAPLYEQLVDALTSDIRSGVLADGAQIPTQRELADRLGIALGTVTRAFHEARRKGLITARVGRGSFVATPAAQVLNKRSDPAAPIDLARNLPPFAPVAEHLAAAIAHLPQHADLSALAGYGAPEGHPRHREALAAWIRRTTTLRDIDSSQVCLCSGATQAMALAFTVISRRGAAIVCDSVTYSGMKTLADYAGLQLVGVPMDEEGMIPKALDKAIRASNATALYALPNLQNPTARTMSLERRAALVEVARKRDIWIVEDDVYAYLAKDIPGATQLATLAPERTFYLGSLKVLCPGLRVGFIVPPTREACAAQLSAALLATVRGAEPLGRMIVAQWIEAGTCDAIASRVAAEAKWRMQRACEIFGRRLERPSAPASLHVWLPLSALDAERAVAEALRANIELAPPCTCRVQADGESGLRLCLGAVPERATLETALKRVRDIVAMGSGALAASIV